LRRKCAEGKRTGMENVKKRDRTRNTAEIKEFSTNVNNASIMTASIKNM
jgi:hypothetical protein